MQLKIDFPDILPHEKILFLIKEIENIFSKEGISFDIEQKMITEDDPWDNLNI